MKLITRSLLLTTLLIVLFTCKDNPVGPDDSNATPGRRDYTWTADTIKAYYVSFNGIWGSSPTDVWIADDDNAIYRYDGQKYYKDKGAILVSPNSIYGSNNRVWIVGQQGAILKYSNNTYLTEYSAKVDNHFVWFGGLSGKDYKEIYTAGWVNYPKSNSGVIIAYNGSSWRNDKVINDSGGFMRMFYSSRNDRYYFLSGYVAEDNSLTYNIFEYDKKYLTKILSTQGKDGLTSIYRIDDYPYFFIGTKVYRYFNNNSEYIFEISDPNKGGLLGGRNRKDILVRMQNGIAHYNGTDLQYLIKFNNKRLLASDAMVFEKDVFVTAKDYVTGYSIIYHGVLR